MATPYTGLRAAWEKVPVAPEKRKTYAMVAVALLTAGGITLWMAGRPNYTPIFTGLSPASAGQVTQQLTALKIPWKLAAGGGTVEVPRQAADTARVELATHNLPSTGQVGYQNLTSLSSAGLTAQQFNLEQLAVLQQDLAATIDGMAGVKSAAVQISVPPASVWAAPASGASKASVYVDFVPGYTPSRTQVSGMMALVAHAVPGLSASNVAVVNQLGQLLDPPGAPSPNSPPGIIALENTMDAKAAASVDGLLTTLVGPGNVSSVVHYQLTMRSSTGSQTLVRSTSPVSVSKSTSSYKGTGAALPVGTAGNVPPVYLGGGGTSKASSSTSHVQSVVGQATTRFTVPAGQVASVSASVLVNQKALKLSKATVTAIRSVVGHALGIPTARQAAAITVLTAAFAAVPVTTVPPVPWYANLRVEAGLGALALIAMVFAIWMLTRRRHGVIEPEDALMASPIARQQAQPPLEESMIASRAQQAIDRLSRITEQSPKEVAEAVARLLAQDAATTAGESREPLA